jgi:hypothetical protein
MRHMGAELMRTARDRFQDTQASARADVSTTA